MVKPQRVFVPGYINDSGMLSVAAGKIVWAEYGFDPRWRVKTFSRIKMYDLATGRTSIIGNAKGRLTAAALSPDGHTVVAVRSNQEYQHQVVLLDVATGNEVKVFPNREQ